MHASGAKGRRSPADRIVSRFMMSAMAVALLALLPLALAQAPIEKVVDDMLKGETGAGVCLETRTEHG